MTNLRSSLSDHARYRGARLYATRLDTRRMNEKLHTEGRGHASRGYSVGFTTELLDPSGTRVVDLHDVYMI